MNQQLFAVAARLAEAGMPVHTRHVSTIIDTKELDLENIKYADSCFRIASILASNAKVTLPLS